MFFSKVQNFNFDLRLISVSESCNLLRNILNTTSQGTTPLHEACLRGQLVNIKWLLDNGADPMSLNRSGCLPLHFTCQHQDADAAVAIIDLIYRYAPNMNPNHLNERQDTPMHYAAYNENDSASTAVRK